MTKKATSILEQKESNLPYRATPDCAPKSFKVVFKSISVVCEPHTIEMKISRSRNPKKSEMLMTYEEYPFPHAKFDSNKSCE